MPASTAFAQSTPAFGLHDGYDIDGSCVANSITDVSITAIPDSVVGVCSSPTDSVTLGLNVDFTPNATNVFDLLIGYGFGSPDIIFDECLSDIFTGTPGFGNFDNENDCGDALSAAYSGSITVSVPCDYDNDGSIDADGVANFFFGWRQQGGGSGLADDISGPKCDGPFVDVKLPLGPKLSVTKEVVNGSGTFDFSASGVTNGAFSLTASDGSNATSDDLIIAYSATTGFPDVVIAETAQAGWQTAIACTNSAGTPIDTTSVEGQLTIPGSSLINAVDQQVISCTFTNTFTVGSLELDKVVEANGSSLFDAESSWSFKYREAGTADPFTAITGTDSVSIDLDAGSYEIAEFSVGGQNLDYDSVLNCGADQASVATASDDADYSVGTVTVVAGETQSCTVTNTLQTAQLSLSKVVNNGGLTTGLPVAADFQLDYSGLVSGSGNGSVPTVTVPAGTYMISEDATVGASDGLTYDTALECTGGTLVPAAGNTSGSLDLAAGDSAVCTFTNTLQTAQIELVKTVENNGALGTLPSAADWTLDFAGPSGIAANGDGAVAAQTVPAGSFTITETAGAGVTAGLVYDAALSCTAGTLTPGADNTTGGLVLGAGDSAVCTFTNTLDTATVSLAKVVDNGGALGTLPTSTDWSVGVTGPFDIDASDDGALSVITVPTGTYTIAEIAGAGVSTDLNYVAALECAGGALTPGADNTSGSLVLASGDAASCTFTNTLETASLQLVKALDQGDVTTDPAVATDWTLSYDGADADGDMTTGDAAVIVPAGDYDISEIGTATNYALTSFDCGDPGSVVTGTIDAPVSLPQSITLADGATTVCTLTNSITQAELTLSKSVIDLTGTAGSAAQDWELSAGEVTKPANTTGIATATGLVTPGSLSLIETLTGNTLAYSADVSCTDANGASVLSVTDADVIETANLGAIPIAAGDKVTCAVTNSLDTATLALVKTVVDANDIDPAVAADWNLTYSGPVNGNGAGGVSAITVPAGTYQIGEDSGPTNYAFTDFSCSDGTSATGTIDAPLSTPQEVVLADEDVVTCTLTNTLAQANLTLTKVVVDATGNDNSVATDWTLTAGDLTKPTGVATTTSLVTPGTLSLTEALSGNTLPYTASYACTDASGAEISAGTDIAVTDSATLGTIPVVAGDDVSCTVTNTLDTLTLTVVKALDNGAVTQGLATETDWTLTYTGPASGSLANDDAGALTDNQVVVPAGDYAIGETVKVGAVNAANYTLSGVACTGGATETTGGFSLTDDATCTVTNAINKAELSLTKIVVDSTGNANSVATDWVVSAGDLTKAAGVATTSGLVTPGSLTIAEQLAGNTLTYAASYICTDASGTVASGSDLSVTDGTLTDLGGLTLAAGDAVACTVTNTLDTVTLTLLKSVVNGDVTLASALAPETAWTLNYAGPATGSVANDDDGTLTDNQIVVPAGEYTFSETPDALVPATANYEQTGLVCAGAEATIGGYNITADTTCTFTNTIQVAQLSLNKVMPSSTALGALPADQWTVSIGATSEADGSIVDLIVPGATAVALGESAGGHDLTYATDLTCSDETNLSYTDGATTGTLTPANGDNISCTFTNVLEAGSLTLTKSLNAELTGVTTSDWTLSFEPVLTSAPVSGSGAGGVAETDVPAGSYTITETLTDTSAEAATYYLSSLSCTAAGPDGARAALGPLSGTADAPVSLPQTVSVMDGEAVSCAFTNATDAARLTLTKAVNDGTVGAGTTVPAAAEWDLTATSSGDSLSGGTGVTGLVTAGTFTLTEALSGTATGDSGLTYTTSYDCGAAGSGSLTTLDGAELSAAVTLAAGDEVTCAITNALQTADLTVVKDVPANSLGVVPSGWTLGFEGPGEAAGTGVTGAGAVTSVIVPIGSYDFTEVLNPAGFGTGTADDYAQYALSSFTCEGADVSGQTAEITGGSVTCTFVNDTNTARLTILKSAVTGTLSSGTLDVTDDFTVGYSGASSDTSTGGVLMDALVVGGTYTITEANASGSGLSYDASMSCTGATSFTNADADVVGSATTDVGTVTVAKGQDVTCRIDNAVKTARITVNKLVAANDLGVAANGWDVSFSGPAGASGTGAGTVTSLTVPVGSYTFAEATNSTAAANDNYALYDFYSLTCDAATVVDLGAEITGDTTCTFENRTDSARLTLVKAPIIAPAGVAGTIASEDTWTLDATGPATRSGTNADWQTDVVQIVPAGNYSISESLSGNTFGYDAEVTCSNETGAIGTVVGSGSFGTDISLAAGSDVTCTITNELQPAELTLVKDVDNGDFGAATPGDWDLTFDGPGAGDNRTGKTGMSFVVPAGQYALSEANGPANYSQTGLTCSGNADTNGLDGVTLASGDAVTCTFFNAISNAQLTLVKNLSNDNGGTAGVNDFGLTAGAEAFTSGQTKLVATGAYALSETLLEGYEQTGLTCEGATLVEGTITLAAGDAATCTFANDDIAPTYNMEKSASPELASVDTLVTYTFTFTNDGVWPLYELTPIDTDIVGLSAITCGDEGSSIAELAGGATATCTATYTVTQDDVDERGNSVATEFCETGRAILNTATSSATDGGENSVSDSDLSDNSARVCLPSSDPGISVEKSILTDVTSVDEEITYQIVVQNTGNVTLLDVMLDDDFVDGFNNDLTFDSGPTVVSGDTVDPGVLNVGETWTYEAKYTVQQPDFNSGALRNTASVTAFTVNQQEVTDGPSDVETLFELSGSIEIIKLGTFEDENEDGLAQEGETISYTLAVKNTGNVTLYGVTVTDDGADVVGSPIDVLEPGEVNDDAYTATYTLLQGDVDAGEYENQAMVEAFDNFENLYDDLSDDSETFDGPDANDPTIVDLPSEASIELLKTGQFEDENGDGFGQVGETVSYAFTVTNTGSVTLTDVIVTDPLVDVSGGPLESLDPGESDSTTFTASYVLKLEDIEAGIVTNVAIATGTLPDGEETVEDESDDPTTVDPDDPTVVVIPGNPEFEIDVIVDKELVSATLLTDPDTGRVIEVTEKSARRLNYTITVPNTGTVPLANPNLIFVVEQDVQGGPDVVIPLDTGPVYVSGDLNEDGILDVDEEWTYSASVLVTQGMVGLGRGQITGTGTFDAVWENDTGGEDVSGSSVALDPKSDDAVTDIEITITSPESSDNDLDIAKATPRNQVMQGDVVPWFIDVTNNAATGTETVRVIDTLPAGFIFQQDTATVNGRSASPRINGREITFPRVQIAAGQTTRIVINTLVSGSVQPGQHTNRVRFIDDEGNSESATASVVVGAEPVFDCGTVIGKVFDDRNQNGYQDVGSGAAAEPGLPGVRVATVNGELITTDAYGRFSVPCGALPRSIGQNFTLKLDTRSLPAGYRLTTENPRTVRLTAGKMTELNFGATISRLVRVDVAANAFVPGTNQPSDRFVSALARAIPQFAETPITMRISYLEQGEGDPQIYARMQAVESLVRQYWRRDGTYRLMIEKTIQRER